MRTIYKYPIEVTDVQHIEMNEGARILSVQTQQGRPCLWALVDTSKPKRKVEIHVHGTGHENTLDFHYIGTFQLHQGALVFHVFAGQTLDSAPTLTGGRSQ